MTSDAETLRRSLDGLRLARIGNMIAGVREHPDATPLLEACARGEITGEELLRQVLLNIERHRTKAS